MTVRQKIKCKWIIHSAATASASVGAGLAQLPGADAPVIVSIEILMIISLGTVFGINLTESSAKSIALSSAATVAGRGISQGLVGWIPVAGNLINASTAFGIVEAMGWSVVKDFDKGSHREIENKKNDFVSGKQKDSVN